jgi:hypothetical protein
VNYVVYLIINGTDAGGGTVLHPFSTLDHWSEHGHHADGRILRAGSLSEHCFGAGQLFGDMAVGSTAMVLANEDGELDSLFNESFDQTAAATVLYALNPDTYAGVFAPTQQYGRQATLRVEQPVFDKKTVTVALRHFRAALELPFMTTKYAGTNSGAPLAGVEGTADDIKGLPKPYVFGKVFNITPKFVNTTKLIYQVDQRGFMTGYSLTVYDKRATLTAGADYADQTDMETNAPAAGQYRKWVAGGCFRLGSTPAGAITCDVTNPPQNSASSTVLNVVNAIINNYAPTNGQLSAATSSLSADCECGVYLDKECTMLEAVNEVLRSVSGFMVFGDSETAALTQITPPGTVLYQPMLDPIQLDETNVLPESIQQIIPGDGANGLPVWRVNLNYKRNYTVMSASDLAGAAATDIAFCEREYRTLKSEDSSVKTQWPRAAEINVFTNLTDATEAQTECDRLLTCFKTRRQCFKLQVPGRAIREHTQFNDGGAYYASDFCIACRVTVTLDRFGWDSGKTFLVIGVDRDLDADIYELTIWG